LGIILLEIILFWYADKFCCCGVGFVFEGYFDFFFYFRGYFSVVAFLGFGLDGACGLVSFVDFCYGAAACV
jgi:hypothetical protein